MRSLLALPSLLLAWVPLAAQQGPPPRPTLDQFPAPLRPYVEPTEGLEGLEYSLALQMGMALGIAAEHEELGKDYRDLGRHHVANWNAQVGALLEELGPEAGDGLVGGALFYDTGVKVDRAAGTHEVLRKPEMRLVADPGLAERFERRRLIAGLCSVAGLSKEDATKLKEILTAETGELGDAEDPWLGHAHSHLLFMTLGRGMWDKYAAGMVADGTPFGPFDQFQATLGEHVRAALLDPLRPELPAADRDGRNFRYEGDVVLRVHAADAEEWSLPATLAETNALDKSPILVVEVEAAKTFRAKAKRDRLRVGMVAGGEHRPLYDDAWPLR